MTLRQRITAITLVALLLTSQVSLLAVGWIIAGAPLSSRQIAPPALAERLPPTFRQGSARHGPAVQEGQR